MGNAVISREVLADEYVPYMGHIANDTVLLDDGSRAEALMTALNTTSLSETHGRRFCRISACRRPIASHEGLLAHRVGLIGIAAGSGIMLVLAVAHSAVELQHG